ncbi:MAG: hypothetical protein ABJA02_03610 [Acidobacteriota bacterium]
MKICPRCSKTYNDDNLNFCLDDGNVLEQAGSAPMPDTVMMNQPRTTSPSPQVPTQYPPVQQAAQPAWNTAPQQQQSQPKKSSKTWVWVLLILGVLALLCGGGFIGFVAYFGSQIDLAANNANLGGTTKKGTPSPSPFSAKNNGTNSSTNTTTASADRTDVEKVDLSEWVRTASAFGNTEFKNGEFFMSAKQKGFYYVLAAPVDTAQTESANTVVTLRNVDNAASRLGYGIVFHSNPTPLQQGYAFLIDTKSQRYRVVHHSPQKEDSVITWTKSDAINSGSQENTLEVRDLPDKVELYINGTLVNSIKNVYGYAGGVVGLYSGDGVNIAFKDLEVRK